MKRTVSIKKTRILVCDPSFTAYGWIVVELSQTFRVIASGCIKTEPDGKKSRIRKSDDRLRRISEINAVLLDLIKTHNISILLSECPHGSQNAVAAVMVGAVLAQLQSIADTLELPIEWYSEEECKKYVLKKRSATKTEMKEAITTRMDIKWRNVKYIDEAMADAGAVFLTAIDKSELLKYIRYE